MSTLDLGVMQFGTLNTDGSFPWKLRHWLAIFKFPPEPIAGVKWGYVMIFSLPIFWRITQSSLRYFNLRMETGWCRPVWILSVMNHNGIGCSLTFDWQRINQ
jgi:hypothetical protein